MNVIPCVSRCEACLLMLMFCSALQWTVLAVSTGWLVTLVCLRISVRKLKINLCFRNKVASFCWCSDYLMPWIPITSLKGYNLALLILIKPDDGLIDLASSLLTAVSWLWFPTLLVNMVLSRFASLLLYHGLMAVALIQSLTCGAFGTCCNMSRIPFLTCFHYPHLLHDDCGSDWVWFAWLCRIIIS